jgi:hypothetical protein
MAQVKTTADETVTEYNENHEPMAVEIRDAMVWVTLKDGRVIGTPLEWYPMLADGTSEQLAHVDLLFDLICWPELDECLSINAMLGGRRPVPITRKQLAQILAKTEPHSG